jgi:hypothetical protein
MCALRLGTEPVGDELLDSGERGSDVGGRHGEHDLQIRGAPGLDSGVQGPEERLLVTGRALVEPEVERDNVGGHRTRDGTHLSLVVV